VQLPGLLEHHRPKTSLQVLRDTLETSGPRGLYSGCSALALSNAAKGGIRFISFTQSQAFLRKTQLGASNPGMSNALAGLTAGAIESVLVVTPGESLKTKIIHDRSSAGGGRLGLKNLNLPQAAVRVVKVDGLRALWSGLGPVLCKQGTNSAVRFATFGWVLDRLRQSWGMDGVGATLTAGALSGVVTT
jgi:solute carrier family 25 citrate transporter 1